MMYCERCRSLFMEPSYIEHRDTCHWLDDRPVMRVYERICPECGCGEIEDCPSCDACGIECLPEDLVDGICPDCRGNPDLQ